MNNWLRYRSITRGIRSLANLPARQGGILKGDVAFDGNYRVYRPHTVYRVSPDRGVQSCIARSGPLMLMPRWSAGMLASGLLQSSIANIRYGHVSARIRIRETHSVVYRHGNWRLMNRVIHKDKFSYVNLTTVSLRSLRDQFIRAGSVRQITTLSQLSMVGVLGIMF